MFEGIEYVLPQFNQLLETRSRVSTPALRAINRTMSFMRKGVCFIQSYPNTRILFAAAQDGLHDLRRFREILDVDKWVDQIDVWRPAPMRFIV
jgi:hypothetical protein